MKTVGQRNLKLLGGQGKTDGRPDGRSNILALGAIFFVYFFGFLRATSP
jgi:hypothetical protein